MRFFLLSCFAAAAFSAGEMRAEEDAARDLGLTSLKRAFYQAVNRHLQRETHARVEDAQDRLGLEDEDAEQRRKASDNARARGLDGRRVAMFHTHHDGRHDRDDEDEDSRDESDERRCRHGKHECCRKCCEACREGRCAHGECHPPRHVHGARFRHPRDGVHGFHDPDFFHLDERMRGIHDAGCRHPHDFMHGFHHPDVHHPFDHPHGFHGDAFCPPDDHMHAFHEDRFHHPHDYMHGFHDHGFRHPHEHMGHPHEGPHPGGFEPEHMGLHAAPHVIYVIVTGKPAGGLPAWLGRLSPHFGHDHVTHRRPMEGDEEEEGFHQGEAGDEEERQEHEIAELRDQVEHLCREVHVMADILHELKHRD